MINLIQFNKFANNKIFKFGSKLFSTSKHSQIIVIGAGTGGLAVSAQLHNNNVVKSKDITIFDQSLKHYYQPGFTKYGGGVINDFNSIVYDTAKLTKDYNFQNVAVKTIDPDSNSLETSDNTKWTYDQLIIASGIEVKCDSIPGLKDLMDDPNKFVGTIYSQDYVDKVRKMRLTFKGGRALFTQPPPPLKCGGAPQKIAYLCEDYWRSNNVKADIHFFTPLPQMFAVKYYSDTLYEIATKRGITPHFTSVLTSVRDGVATFKNTTDNTTFEEKFDFLHAVPLLRVPSFLNGSKVSNASGFVEVDSTMRHVKYSNIWALGDCVSLPNAKTAAALLSQAPVLVYNLENQLKHKGVKTVRYDGYSACPLFLSKNSLLLAEFREYNDENGNLVRVTDETIQPGKQNQPRQLYYYITKLFTHIYPSVLRGRWFGKYTVFKPQFKEGQSFDPRKYYLLGIYSLPICLIILILLIIV